MLWKYNGLEIEVNPPSVSTISRVFPDMPINSNEVLLYAQYLIIMACPVFQDHRLINKVYDVLTLEEIKELTLFIIKEVCKR